MNRFESIERAGLSALGAQATPSEKRLVQALAAMIHLAVGSPSRVKASKVDPEKLPYGPKQVFDELEKHCAHIVQLRPYEQSSFGKFGRMMARIQGLEIADLDRVTQWIAGGGLATWPTKVTWTHVVRHYANWVSYARAWESEGSSGAGGAFDASAWR